MKKLFATIITLVIILSSKTSFASPPVEIWRNGVKLSTTYNKIQQAIDAAQPGDVIRILTGTYYENLKIKKKNGSATNTFRLEGAAGATVTIDGGDSTLQKITNNSRWTQIGTTGVYRTLVPYSGNQTWKRVIAASISTSDSLLATYWHKAIFDTLPRGGGIIRQNTSDTIKIKLSTGEKNPNKRIINIGKADAVIRIDSSSYWVVSNLQLKHGGFAGIYLAGIRDSNIVFDKIKISSTFRGITTEETPGTGQSYCARNIVVKNCNVSNLMPTSTTTNTVLWQGYADGSSASDDSQAPQRSTGIMFKAVKNSEVRNSEISGWWDGMKLTGVSSKAHHNTFFNLNDDMVELESNYSNDIRFYNNFGYNLYVGISVINNYGGNVYIFRNRLVNTRPMREKKYQGSITYGYCIKLGTGWNPVKAQDVKIFNNSFYAKEAVIWDARTRVQPSEQFFRMEFVNNIFSSGHWKTNFKNGDTLSHSFINNSKWINNLWIKNDNLHEKGIKIETSADSTFLKTQYTNPMANLNLNIKSTSKALNNGTNYPQTTWPGIDSTIAIGNYDIGANEKGVNDNDSVLVLIGGQITPNTSYRVADEVELESINENLSQVGILIYPNPVEDEMIIKVNPIIVNSSNIKIYSAIGETIYSQNIEDIYELKINTKQFPKGTYIIDFGKERKIFVK